MLSKIGRKYTNIFSIIQIFQPFLTKKMHFLHKNLLFCKIIIIFAPLKLQKIIILWHCLIKFHKTLLQR